ncbi:MAG: thiol-disulfide oxidoreductase DCC family protein [Nitrospiria bacterium]
MTQEKIIVLFDSLCPLCTDTVTFLKKRNDKHALTFISMHSKKGRTYMEKYGVTLEMETFVFIKNPICLIRSDAALAIARHLGGVWSFLYFFSVIPRPLRDRVYTFVARNRYRWFGRHKTCVLPP